jgi:tRNA modification GTPase
MVLRKDTTICAPATSAGGAIALIRISGPESLRITERLFYPSDRDLDINNQPGHTVIHGEIRENGEVIDEVLVTLFRAPRSYTGEDSVEISCHASRYIISRILELLIRNGAIAALPGEFTQRAFFNGKMDLSQAEAVADLVASSSKAAHYIAMNQMRGGFSAEIAKLRAELLRFASLIELELDFGEEDVEFADRRELKQIIMQAKELAESLASTFRTGNAVKNGIPVAIIGKPNSGKSTLLNALLNEEKAIVSEIPGTTRDAIEDTIVIKDLEYRFIDTAGLRDTSDVVENLGIRKTHEKIGQASVVLLVDDVTDDAETINRRIRSVKEMVEGSETSLIILINKSDLMHSDRTRTLKKQINIALDESLLFISAKQKTGLDDLRMEIDRVALNRKLSSDDVIITNIRHYEAMLHISESLGRILSGMDEDLPEDLIAIDLRQAIHYLGEVTGEITTDEILDNIFMNFCIGK